MARPGQQYGTAAPQERVRRGAASPCGSLPQDEAAKGETTIEKFRRLIDNEDYLDQAIQRIAQVISNEIYTIDLSLAGRE
jgi:hypothetical protein